MWVRSPGRLLRSGCAEQAQARIYGDTGDPHFVVQMGPRTPAFVSYLRDCLSFTDSLSLVHPYLREMSIMSFDVATVVQDYRAVFTVDGFDACIAGGMYRRADWARYVQSGMELHSPRYGG